VVSKAPPGSSPCTWIMYQGWRDLLFLSWPVPLPTLQALLPPGLPADPFDGSGWVTLVPLRMQGLHLRLLPSIPGASTFGELNLRAYVRVRGEPGVYFFSIDAASWLGSLVADWVFHLPYHDAHVSLTGSDGSFRFRSVRKGAQAARFAATYRRTGSLANPKPGSLEGFLLERYASFQGAPDGRLYRGPLSHDDWQVAPAEAEVSENGVTGLVGLPAPENAVAHYSPGTDTHVCWVELVDGA